MTAKLTIECRSFTAFPMGEGRVRLEISEPVAPKKAAYGSSEAITRLSEIFGRPMHRNCLAYWRKQGLPFTKIGDKKIVYNEDEITNWARGRFTTTLP
jgi:hypothetical protein